MRVGADESQEERKQEKGSRATKGPGKQKQ